jgi:hypothetical protein
MKSTLAHQIKIPNSFMGRIHKCPIPICHFHHKLHLLNQAPAYTVDRVWFYILNILAYRFYFATKEVLLIFYHNMYQTLF